MVPSLVRSRSGCSLGVSHLRVPIKPISMACAIRCPHAGLRFLSVMISLSRRSTNRRQTLAANRCPVPAGIRSRIQTHRELLRTDNASTKLRRIATSSRSATTEYFSKPGMAAKLRTEECARKRIQPVALPFFVFECTRHFRNSVVLRTSLVCPIQAILWLEWHRSLGTDGQSVASPTGGIALATRPTRPTSYSETPASPEPSRILPSSVPALSLTGEVQRLILRCTVRSFVRGPCSSLQPLLLRRYPKCRR